MLYEACRAPIALYGVAYGDQYETCLRPLGHAGPCHPAAESMEPGDYRRHGDGHQLFSGGREYFSIGSSLFSAARSAPFDGRGHRCPARSEAAAGSWHAEGRMIEILRRERDGVRVEVLRAE